MLTYTYLFDSLASELHLLNIYLKKINNKNDYAELNFFVALVVKARKLVNEEGDIAIPSRNLIVSLLSGILFSYNGKYCNYPLNNEDMEEIINNFLSIYTKIIIYDGVSKNKSAIEASAHLIQEIFNYQTADKDLLEFIEKLIFRLMAIFLISKIIQDFNKTQDVSQYELLFRANDDDMPISVYAKYRKYTDSLFDQLNFYEKLTSGQNAKILGTIAISYLQASNLMDKNIFK